MFATGCEDDRVPSGIDAYVFWAECDTMQSFYKYTGMVYLIPYSRFGEIDSSNWDSLKTRFDSTMCTEGYMSNFFDPGDYVAEPDTFISSTFPGVITVEPDLLKEVEIRFVYCQ